MTTKTVKSDPVKTILVIVVGLLIIGLITHRQGWLWAAGITGLAGVFSNYLAGKIDFIWMKLSAVLGLIVPNILLSVVFFLILTPIAWLSRTGKKDPLSLKNTRESMFKNTDHSFDKKYFERLW